MTLHILSVTVHDDATVLVRFDGDVTASLASIQNNPDRLQFPEVSGVGMDAELSSTDLLTMHVGEAAPLFAGGIWILEVGRPEEAWLNVEMPENGILGLG